MIRRSFISAFAVLLAPITALAKRKPKRRAKRAPPELLNEIEKRQLLSSYSPAQIQNALDVRFLGLWTVEELEGELRKRESPS